MSTISPTLIEVRDFAIGPDLYRRRASDLSDWDDLIEYTFNAFNRDERYFRLHFHFSRETHCVEDELLTKEDWNDGIYFVGANRLFYAHFVTRARHEPRGYYRRREPSPSPVSPTPEPGSPVVPWTMPPLPPMNEQGVYEYPPSNDTPAAAAPAPTRRPAIRPGGGPRRGLARGRGRGRAPQPAQRTAPRPVPPPAQPVPAIRRPASQRPNTNSTNVYTIGPPIPADRYPNSRYFSSPFTFIPLQPAPPRPRTHAQQYRAPLPSSDTPVARPAAATYTSAVPVRAPAAPMLPPRPAVRQPAGGSTSRLPTTGSSSGQPIEISSAEESSSDDSSMDIDSNQHPGSHQPTAPLPPPPVQDEDKMELSDDPISDSDAQNTPLPPPTFDEYADLQYPVVRPSPGPRYEGQTDDEEEDLTLQSPLYPIPEFEERPDDENEDLTLQLPLYPGSEFEQPPDEEEEQDLTLQFPLYSNSEFDHPPADHVEDEQMSIAPTSPGSGGLFVRDETEAQNFEAALAWEDDGTQQSVAESELGREEEDAMTFIASPSAAPSSAVPTSAGTGLFVSDGSETRGFAGALEWEEDDGDDDDDEEMEDEGEGGVEVRRR
ncbi:hypothetical protein J4E83_002510 [Alternaria metachromatica]|uniref:uncharacterized protein n=1 Tax=Alternaria metachromatica TaxID=283354 RepID=UPI0020C2AFD0|nr:uncharacterized protein J4E83_002510 [Alternaria metachromatica]KAI4630984.1 hypothetical protein J4E83_002510 [Alternaria metachromatica]